MYNNNNIFAKIINKECTAKIIYENDYAMALEDINPSAKIHVLVIPKGQYISFYDLITNGTQHDIFGFCSAVKHVIDKLPELSNGYKIIYNTGINGQQEIMHCHAHIIGGELINCKITTGDTCLAQ